MTVERKNLLTAVVVITIVYVGTIWQRPMFSPCEYDFALKQMTSATDFAALLSGLFGKALGFNIVSFRLAAALSGIITALIVRAVTIRESDENTGLDETGEFLVMASQLLYIKSKKVVNFLLHFSKLDI